MPNVSKIIGRSKYNSNSVLSPVEIQKIFDNLEADSNGIISALPAGNVSIAGASNNLIIDTQGIVVLGDDSAAGNGIYLYVSDVNEKIELFAPHLDISELPVAANDGGAASAGVLVGEAYVVTGTGAVHRRLT